MATIRTLKLKPTPPPLAAGTATPEAAAAQAAPPGLESAASAPAARSGKSRKALLWLTLAVVGCAAAILALQYMEFSFYREAPSVWPLQ